MKKAPFTGGDWAKPLSFWHVCFINNARRKHDELGLCWAALCV